MVVTDTSQEGPTGTVASEVVVQGVTRARRRKEMLRSVRTGELSEPDIAAYVCGSRGGRVGVCKGVAVVWWGVGRQAGRSPRSGAGHARRDISRRRSRWAPKCAVCSFEFGSRRSIQRQTRKRHKDKI